MSFLMEQGQTLVCLGDSITQADPGYVSLMAALIAAKYPERGHSGRQCRHQRA